MGYGFLRVSSPQNDFMVLLFIHPRVIPNLYDFRSSAEFDFLSYV